MSRILVILFFLALVPPVVSAGFEPFDSPFPQKPISASSIKTEGSMASSVTVPILWSIRIYQVLFSAQDGPNCIYHPSCSAYGQQSLRKYGPFWGTVMTADRWLRCNPFGVGGDDPIEENFWF